MTTVIHQPQRKNNQNGVSWYIFTPRLQLVKDREDSMRKLMIGMAMIFLIGATGLAFAQANAAHNAKNPNAHALHKRFRLQERQIAKDLKSGKITQAQANAKRDNLRAVHEKEVKFKHQNGSHELTDDQAKKLNAEMDKN